MWFVPQKSNKDIFSKSKSKAKTGKKKEQRKKTDALVMCIEM